MLDRSQIKFCGRSWKKIHQLSKIINTNTPSPHIHVQTCQAQGKIHKNSNFRTFCLHHFHVILHRRKKVAPKMSRTHWEHVCSQKERKKRDLCCGKVRRENYNFSTFVESESHSKSLIIFVSHNAPHHILDIYAHLRSGQTNFFRNISEKLEHQLRPFRVLLSIFL